LFFAEVFDGLFIGTGFCFFKTQPVPEKTTNQQPQLILNVNDKRINKNSKDGSFFAKKLMNKQPIN
jgi:hypothetical protein